MTLFAFYCRDGENGATLRERLAAKESVRSHMCEWLEAEALSHHRGTTIGLHLD